MPIPSLLIIQPNALVIRSLIVPYNKHGQRYDFENPLIKENSYHSLTPKTNIGDTVTYLAWILA